MRIKAACHMNNTIRRDSFTSSLPFYFFFRERLNALPGDNEPRLDYVDQNSRMADHLMYGELNAGMQYIHRRSGRRVSSLVIRGECDVNYSPLVVHDSNHHGLLAVLFMPGRNF